MEHAVKIKDSVLSQAISEIVMLSQRRSIQLSNERFFAALRMTPIIYLETEFWIFHLNCVPT